MILNRYLATFLLVLAGSQSFAGDKVLTSPNGIVMPPGYMDWQLIGSSHRTDKNQMKVILGNDIAVSAARSGKTNPWPAGSILAKLVWKDEQMPEWKAAVAPGEFLMADFMIKDQEKYAATNGWGYARWKGADLKPYGKDASFAGECSGCHAIRLQYDSVFTRPVGLP